MGWEASWSVTGGERGARRGTAENRVYQHEHVRFRVHLRDVTQQARDFVLDARNWLELPRMRVTGIDSEGADIRAVEVASARDNLLDFDYEFQWAGRKRIQFKGQLDLRRADADLHGGMGARATTMRPESSTERDRHGADVYATYPPLSLTIAFEVVEEATEGEARATMSGDGPRARERERLIDDERREAERERRRDAAAARADRESRESRARDARGALPAGILRLPSPWTHVLTDAELDALDEATMDEYARDLRAAIRETPPVSLDGNRYFDGRDRYSGYWTWAHDDGDIVFYFLATRIAIEGAGMRACDDDEAARARSHSSMRFAPDDMIVARLPGQRRRVLAGARAFAQDASWERLTAVIEAVDYVLTAFDVVELATGAGAIIAGVRRAARWLIRSAARLARRGAAGAVRHGDDIARAAVRAGAHSDDAVRGSSELSRGLGDTARASGDDAARGVARADGTAARAVDDDAARGVAGPDGTTARAADDAARVDDGALLDDAFDAMTSAGRRGTAAAAAAAPEPYTATTRAWGEFRRARREFARLQRRYARRIGLRARSGAQVHHAIELNVITRYGDDVFSVDELNSIANMRGIVPERTASGAMHTRYGLRQLHNSAIRRRWDRYYDEINRVIANEGLLAGTPAYRTRVRALLEHARDSIDHEFGALFSGSGARLPSTFVDEATDSALRGGRSAETWTPGMLPEDLASIDRAVPGGAALDPPPALRGP
jgi:hypothetical protein